MKRLINHSFRTSAFFVLTSIVAIAIVGYFTLVPQSAATVTSFTVNSTLDLPELSPGDGICNAGVALCTLRAAITESNYSGGANVITVPSGNYTLTLGPADDEFSGAGASMDSGDLDIVDLSAFALGPQLTSVTINGAGAGATIIDGGGIDRVLDINNFAAFGSSVDVTLQDLTIRNGNAPTSGGFNESGGGIQFDGFDNLTTFLPTGTLTINNCNITSNTAAGQGGGILAIFGSLIMDGSEVSGNTASNAAGGGISYDGSSSVGLRTLQITNSSISSNHANHGTFGNGGGVWAGGNANKTINYSVVTSNTSGAQGGGVFNGSGSLTMNFNVIVGNTASGNPASTGFRNNTGPINAENNWWGCNLGPASSPCDRVSGPLGSGIASWLTLSHTASPNTIAVNQSTTLQADFFTNNLNTGIGVSDLVALNGRAVVFNNPVLGTISAADPTINGGKANATFTAGPTGGNGSADATVDQATVTASILVGEEPGLTCPSDITTVNDTDQCSASVAFSTSATGSPTPTVTCMVGSTVITSPHEFPVGTTNVQCTATNGVGSDDTCSFNVTVNDTQNPTITAPGAVFANTGPGATSCSAFVSDATLGTANAGDNCAVTISRSGVPAGNIFPVGQTIVTYTATDASNNTATATQTVTVVDNTPPVIISCAPPQSAPADNNGQAPVPDFTGSVVASDNCGVTSITQNPVAGTMVGIGVHNVTITVRDAANNSTTCMTTFTVTAQQLTAVGPANVWIGLKNSDDIGTKFDLLAQVLRNGVVVGSGQLNDVPGGSSGFNNAVQRTINMALSGGPVTFQNGDTLSFRLSVRIAASSGHVSGTARLWYNDSAANSRFNATISGSTNTYYLHNAFVLGTTVGPGPKKTIDVLVNRNVGGNPFKPFGTWSKTL